MTLCRRGDRDDFTHPQETVVDAEGLRCVEKRFKAPLPSTDHPEHVLVGVAHETPVREADVGTDVLDRLGKGVGVFERNIGARGDLTVFVSCDTFMTSVWIRCQICEIACIHVSKQDRSAQPSFPIYLEICLD